MTRPEEALARARAEAALKRSAGAYADDVRGFTLEPTDTVTRDKLLEWAVIEPDPEQVYSTRRLGAPVTFVKQGILRALRQWHLQLLAQQTRFNLHLAIYMSRLEDRIQELEASLPGADEDAGDGRPAAGGGEPAP